MNPLRQTIEFANFALSRIKRNQRCRLDGLSSVKVNLGCGLAVAPGWINVDGSMNAIVANLPKFLHRVAYRVTGAQPYYAELEYCRVLSEHRFVHHDLALGLPLADNVADFVYSSHFVEHLFRKDAENLLAEIYRVLKPGGRVRIAIPDLEYAISLYGKGEKTKMLSNYFFVEDRESYYSRHKYMYDYDMISEVLAQCGFQDIRRCRFQEGLVPDIEILDRYPDESLFVEAMR